MERVWASDVCGRDGSLRFDNALYRFYRGDPVPRVPLQMLRESSTTLAILISSLTFGLGHIVNLLNGAAVLDTALQLIYAFSIGMMLSVFVVKTGHILPCCIFHGAFNALSAFANGSGETMGKKVVTAAVISVVTLGYAWYLWKWNHTQSEEKPDQT